MAPAIPPTTLEAPMDKLPALGIRPVANHDKKGRRALKPHLLVHPLATQTREDEPGQKRDQAVSA